MLLCFSLILLAGTIFAASPTCKKIDDCACTPTNTSKTGIINFWPLVNSTKAQAVFMVNGTSSITKDEYTFMYNPCVGFSVSSLERGSPCKDDLICQAGIKFNLTYNLGAAGSTAFSYDSKGNLFAVYNSKAQHNRTSVVHLICDEKETTGKFVFIAEPKMYFYEFNFTSMCACPGKCPNKTLVPDEWVQTDKCLYRQMRTGKVVNLQGLATPLKIATDKYTTYYYSPCDGLELGSLDEKCKDVSVCKQDMSTSPPTYIGIGRKEVEVTEDDGDVVLHYPVTTDGGKCLDVKLMCDQSADDPILTTTADDKMTLKAKAVCPQ